MNTFLVLVTLLTIVHLNEAVVQDLSGSYSFENCVCTVLRCLKPSPYQLNQSPNGNFTIYYGSCRAAALGRTTSFNNGRSTLVSMHWLPGMDFNTSCTGTWMPTRRFIHLRCGDQIRYCSAQLKQINSNVHCGRNSSASFGVLWRMNICLLFLLLIEKVNH